MGEILIVIRIHINELDIVGVEDYYLTVRERLATVDGSYGYSLWRGVPDRQSLLVVYEYRDVDAADRGLKALTGIRLLAESQDAEYHPADVIRVHVEGRDGRRISETPKPGNLSITVRIADPGYGKDLLDDVAAVFQHLALIPGYVGSAYGHSDTLDEEVIGIVTWESAAAFKTSLPPTQRSYKVQLYARVY